ncbi:hypothetical protein TNCV_2635231 [Trichonephila clavipes]|nr:hypothetical protein TNCV_2635231 [Trichonephila clavipes]
MMNFVGLDLVFADQVALVTTTEDAGKNRWTMTDFSIIVVEVRAGANSFATPGKEPVHVQWLLLSSSLAGPR